MSTEDLNGRLARWTLKLRESDFDITYRPRAKLGYVDALSRLRRASMLDNPDDKKDVEQVIYANVVSRQPTSEPAPLLASKRN